MTYPHAIQEETPYDCSCEECRTWWEMTAQEKADATWPSDAAEYLEQDR